MAAPPPLRPWILCTHGTRQALARAFAVYELQRVHGLKTYTTARRSGGILQVRMRRLQLRRVPPPPPRTPTAARASMRRGAVPLPPPAQWPTAPAEAASMAHGTQVPSQPAVLCTILKCACLTKLPEASCGVYNAMLSAGGSWKSETGATLLCRILFSCALVQQKVRNIADCMPGGVQLLWQRWQRSRGRIRRRKRRTKRQQRLLSRKRVSRRETR